MAIPPSNFNAPVAHNINQAISGAAHGIVGTEGSPPILAGGPPSDVLLGAASVCGHELTNEAFFQKLYTGEGVGSRPDYNEFMYNWNVASNLIYLHGCEGPVIDIFAAGQTGQSLSDDGDFQLVYQQLRKDNKIALQAVPNPATHLKEAKYKDMFSLIMISDVPVASGSEGRSVSDGLSESQQLIRDAADALTGGGMLVLKTGPTNPYKVIDDLETALNMFNGYFLRYVSSMTNKDLGYENKADTFLIHKAC